MDTSGTLEVIFEGSGRYPHFPLCTKEQITVPLLGCCPAPAPSYVAGVLVCLYHHAVMGVTITPSSHPGGAALSEQHYLSKSCALQKPYHATTSGERSGKTCEIDLNDL